MWNIFFRSMILYMLLRISKCESEELEEATSNSFHTLKNSNDKSVEFTALFSSKKELEILASVRMMFNCNELKRMLEKCNHRETVPGSLPDTDIDECSQGDHDCDVDAKAACTNTAESFTCACKSGYSGDGKSCVDVDECRAESGTNCHSNASCSNTDGSFMCACNTGFTGDGTNCVVSETSEGTAIILCSVTVRHNPAIFVGDVTTVRCAPNCGTSGVVWGTANYTDDSRVCKAAVHDGKITDSEGGIVHVEKLPGQVSYLGSTANDVTTSRWGNWGASFRFCDTAVC